MTDWTNLALAAAAGALLAGAYLAALWAGLRRLPGARHPAGWLLGTLALRLALAGGGFLALTLAGGWPAAAAGLAGFVAVRTLVVGRVRRRLTAAAGGEGATP
jgi:F1F0 ATPase subunit 2